MAENLDTLHTIDLVAHISALTIQVQENSNKFMNVEAENANLYVENWNLKEQVQRLLVVNSMP